MESDFKEVKVKKSTEQKRKPARDVMYGNWRNPVAVAHLLLLRLNLAPVTENAIDHRVQRFNMSGKVYVNGVGRMNLNYFRYYLDTTK